jgi:hypothetical protein
MCVEHSDYVQEDGYHYYKPESDAIKRTKVNTVLFALLLAANAALKSFLGVKGLSILLLLKTFDYVVDSVIDPMHHLFLHVVPEILDLWFSEEYKVRTS